MLAILCSDKIQKNIVKKKKKIKNKKIPLAYRFPNLACEGESFSHYIQCITSLSHQAQNNKCCFRSKSGHTYH